MPAEFEPIEAVWLARPHNPETWPGILSKAQSQHAAFGEEVARHARLHVLGGAGPAIPTDDAWIRDYGPIFVTNGAGELACHDFHFNGWGGKYGGLYENDDCVPQQIAQILGIPCLGHDMVLEGGSIDVNGCGTVLTTAQCLLNKNRNPDLTRDQIEKVLCRTLGVSHVLWLPGGIIGDDTDGHVDDIARFAGPDTVLAVRPGPGHPDGPMLEENWLALRKAVDQDGKKFHLLPLPAPEPILYDFPPDRFGPGGRLPVPASYANFLILNDAVLAPIFGQTADDAALRVLETAFLGRKIIGLRSEHLVAGLGALHCLSMQQPCGKGAAPFPH